MLVCRGQWQAARATDRLFLDASHCRSHCGIHFVVCVVGDLSQQDLALIGRKMRQAAAHLSLTPRTLMSLCVVQTTRVHNNKVLLYLLYNMLSRTLNPIHLNLTHSVVDNSQNNKKIINNSVFAEDIS